MIVSNKNNIKVSPKNNREQTKINIIDNDKNKKDSKSVYLIDKIKPVYAQEIYNNGNIIGYNHSLFKSIWINLYRTSFIISTISLISSGFYSFLLYKDKKYDILKADILSSTSLILMIFISASGMLKYLPIKRLTLKKKIFFYQSLFYLAL